MKQLDLSGLFKCRRIIRKDKSMELTKQTITDKIEIVGQFNAVQVRTATVITEDGVEHREI